MNRNYNLLSHWETVASHIAERGATSFVAGDDTPFTRYLRSIFLRRFRMIDFSARTILEVGSGPGGNLLFVASQHPRHVVGCDISPRMLDLAKTEPCRGQHESGADTDQRARSAFCRRRFRPDVHHHGLAAHRRRGRGRRLTTGEYLGNVRPMHKRYVEATRVYADLVVTNEDKPKR